jgi:hypothetical protein
MQYAVGTERRGQVVNTSALNREIPASNFCLETGYPVRWFPWVSSVPPGECRDSTLKSRPRPLPSAFFPVHNSLITPSLDAT